MGSLIIVNILQLTNNNAMPKYICSGCQEALTAAHDFRESILKVQLELKTFQDLANCKSNQAVDTEFVQLYEDDKNEVNLSNEVENTEPPDHCSMEKYAEDAKYKTEGCMLELKASAENELRADEENHSKNTNPTVLNNDEKVTAMSIGNEETQSKSQISRTAAATKKQRAKSKNKKNKDTATEQTNVYICDQCGNNFTSRHHFKIHLRRHSGLKTCACE